MTVRGPSPSLASLIAVTLAACGSDVPTSVLALESGSSCLRVSGQFDAVFSLTAAEGGACTKAKQVSHDTLTFDEAGQFVSPAAALLPCSTAQLDCTLAVSCESVAIGARFEGILSPDAESITGSAQLRGGVSDCERVWYAMEATRRLP